MNSNEEQKQPDLMTDWYFKEDVHGDKTLIYKRTGPNEITLIAQCFNEQLAVLIARAPELLEQLKQLKEENERLKEDSNKDLFVIGSQLQEIEGLREREKELVEALRELNSYAPDFTEYPNSLSTFDLGLQAASKKVESLLSNVKQ